MNAIGSVGVHFVPTGNTRITSEFIGVKFIGPAAVALGMIVEPAIDVEFGFERHVAVAAVGLGVVGDGGAIMLAGAAAGMTGDVIEVAGFAGLLAFVVEAGRDAVTEGEGEEVKGGFEAGEQAVGGVEAAAGVERGGGGAEEGEEVGLPRGLGARRLGLGMHVLGGWVTPEIPGRQLFLRGQK